MNDSNLTRRAFTSGALLLGLGSKPLLAQGFAGLGRDAANFAPVVPGVKLTFPADHAAHPDYRIEWWYVTANLSDADGAACGIQWTLFRQAMATGPQQPGWENQQIWMGHAAVTRADTHHSAETYARGGVGQAGVTIRPFHAWIDNWAMQGGDAMSSATLAPMQLTASGEGFSYALWLDASQPLVLQGEAGYSKKSERGQASYYYSQPYFRASGTLTVDGRPMQVSGQAWMDREWSSQPLSSDQTGWDWFSLHLGDAAKLMLFRLRQSNGENYFSGNWITGDGRSEQIAPDAIKMTPLKTTEIAGRKLPTTWRIEIASRGLAIETTPLNARAWMGTSFPYWEGPVFVTGSHSGAGYLEMTGY